MNPLVWGPSAWTFLHTITLAYPDCPNANDKNNIKGFFNSLRYVLPCHSCKNHFNKNLNKYPLTDEILCSKEKLIKWLINIHNEINIVNGKPTWSYVDVLTHYDNLYNNSSNKVNTYLIIFIIILIVICLSVIGWYTYKKISQK